MQCIDQTAVEKNVDTKHNKVNNDLYNSLVVLNVLPKDVLHCMYKLYKCYCSS